MPKLPVRMVKRARRGCASVYYWRKAVTTKDGKRRNLYRTLGSDYEAACAQYDKLEAHPPAAEPEPVLVAESPITVEAFSRRWLAEYAATRRTVRGRDQAEQRFRDFLWPTLGSVLLTELKPADLRRLNAELEQARPVIEVEGRKRCKGGVGLLTRRHLLADIRCVLRYAVEEAEVLSRSPWRPKMMPKKPEAAPDPLNDLEWAEVTRAAPTPWKPVLALMAETGLRWGEVRAVRWKDAHVAPYAHLVVSRSHDGPTKSRKVREVPLLPEAEAILDALERPANRDAAIFPWLPETASWIRRHVIAHSWVKDFHVHRMRHTFATKYLERGGSLEVLQRILGHSSIKQTECYGRLRPHAVAAEVARISVATSVAMKATEPSEARKSL